VAELLPDKFTPVEHSLIGEAAAILTRINERSASVGQLYLDHKSDSTVATFDSFAGSLTFLYAAGLVEYSDHIVRRA